MKTNPVLPLPVVAVLAAAGAVVAPQAATGAPPAEAMKSEAPRPENRLAKEKSPYLLQHRHNPVDWYPWGEEAFAKAKRENKPVLLSIGYSTCHWCHVMERESFENKEVAAVINERFVAVKLDREERPDIDQIYMTAMQALELGGGWPLNVFLTPDRKPFFGGTYFPKEKFIGMLRHVDRLWRENEKELQADADNLTTALRKHMAEQKAPEGDGLPGAEPVLAGARRLAGQFDGLNGGWGKAPKFPQPQVPQLLLTAVRMGAEKSLTEQVAFTCRRMAAGGIFDHVGGGFARYSTDDKWLVPHFEKMLYDNAQLLDLYLETGLATGDARHFETARAVARYVLRDMTHPDGGWYSAEDADSEGHEGKFHCWTLADFRAAVGEADADWAAAVLGVTAKGNFEDHSHPQPLKGLNVLHLAEPDKVPSAADAARLASVRERLFRVREQRVRPHRDDKILTSWNGLMLGAMARAGVVLDEPAFLAAARKNLAFVRARLWDEAAGTLHHRWRDGERDAAQLLAAWANYLHGTVELYQATLDPEVLAFAVKLADGMLKRFHDAAQGGFFVSAGGDDLLFRAKDDYDGAEPSGNAVAALALLRLAAITENKAFRTAAEQTLRFHRRRLTDAPEGLPLMLRAAAFAGREPFRVVIAGDPQSEAARRLVAAAHRAPQPFRVILGNAGPVEPFALTLPARDGKPTAYVCTGRECRPPTDDPATVTKHLGERGSGESEK